MTATVIQLWWSFVVQLTMGNNPNIADISDSYVTIEALNHSMIVQNPLPDALRYVYFAIGALGILGNGFVVFVMFASRHLRRRSANMIIINQSIIDGLASLFLIAITVPYVGVPTTMVCKFWLNRLPLWCLLISSTYNILCLALDRHLAILHPLWHKAFITKKKIILLLLFPWIFGIVFNAAYALPTSVVVNETCHIFQKWPSETVQLAFGVLLVNIQYIIPILLQIYLYGRIVWLIRKRAQTGPSTSNSRNVARTNSSSLQEVNRTSFSWSRAQKNSVKTAAIVSICFMVCWTCDQIYFTMYFLRGSKYYDVTFFQYTLIFVVANSAINPFIYALQYESFQRTVRKLFSKKENCEPTSNSSTANAAAPINSTSTKTAVPSYKSNGTIVDHTTTV